MVSAMGLHDQDTKKFQDNLDQIKRYSQHMKKDMDEELNQFIETTTQKIQAINDTTTQTEIDALQEELNTTTTKLSTEI